MIKVDTQGFQTGGYVDQSNKNRELQVNEAQQNLNEQKAQFEQSNIKKQQYLEMVQNQVQQLQNYMSTAIDPAHIEYGQKVADSLKQSYGGAVAKQLGVDGYVNQMIDLAVRMPNSVDSAKIEGMSKAAGIKATGEGVGVNPKVMVPGYIESLQLGETQRHNKATEGADLFAGGMSNPTGMNPDKFLETLPSGIRGQVKAMANGDQPFPTPYALAKSPNAQKMMEAVYAYNPEANANMFKSVQAFNTGKQGDAVRSFGRGIAHLNTLDGLADALGNNNVKAINLAANKIKDEMGYTAPSNFDAAKNIVGAEIVKAIVGAGGTGEDRDNATKVINNAKSPAQLKGVISTYKSLMKGQLQGLQNQYEVSTGRKDFAERLAPEARLEIQDSIPTFSGPDEQGFSDLPAGTKFIDASTGKTLVKH